MGFHGNFHGDFICGMISGSVTCIDEGVKNWSGGWTGVVCV